MDLDRQQIIVFVYENQLKGKPVSWGDLEAKFVRKQKEDREDLQKCAKQTFVNHFKYFRARGKLKKKLDDEGNPVYYIPKKFQPYADELKERSSFNNLADSLEARWLDPLHRLIKEIKSKGKDPYAVFNDYCFAFVDDEPIAFGKGYAEFIMALDRRIRTSYSRDFDACMERCMGDKRTSQSIGACLPVCQEEIGRTVGEYWRKLKKKAKKLPFPLNLWVAQGYSEEEIEEMLDEIKKQDMHKEKG